MGTVEIFNIPVEGLNAQEIINRIERSKNHPYWIVTANPEILLYAKKNPAYAETLRHADVRIVDSIGLKLAGWLHGKNLVRTTGVDLAEALVKRAHETGQSVAFLGDHKGSGEYAFTKMAERYPGLKGFAENGGTITPEGEGDAHTDEVIQRLILNAPDMLLVAFGHPKQESWIAKNLHAIPSIKAVIGVGGTFDYWRGAARRAPAWMRIIGLEWLYRLTKEPNRWKRIWNAVVIFPFAAAFDVISGKKRGR